MTLKQRRQHSDLIARLDKLHRDKYSKVPTGYIFGKDEEEDEKYKAALDTLKTLLDELHALEEAVKDR